MAWGRGNLMKVSKRYKLPIYRTVGAAVSVGGGEGTAVKTGP